MSKRKRILVDPDVQWAIGFRIMFHWGVLLTCLVIIGAAVHLMVGTSNKSFGDAFWDAIMSQRSVVVVMLVLLPVFVRDTMKLSNRFAGPMYRLRMGFKNTMNGEPYQRLKFRTGDFWLEAADEFNQVAEELDKLRKRNRELESQLKEQQVSV